MSADEAACALGAARRQVADRPGSAALQRTLGRQLSTAADLAAAERWLARSVAGGADPDTMLDLADMRRLLGRSLEAEALAVRSVGVDRAFGRAHRFLASSYFDRARWSRAELHARAATALDPSVGEVWRILGMLPRHRRQAEGERFLTRALALDPEDRLARFELAEWLDRVGRVEAGTAQRQRAIGVADWRDLPVIINCRDRVTPLRRLLDWLERAGHRNIVLLDNQSTYPPLLRFYDQLPGHRLVRVDANLGHTALWRLGLLERLGIDTPFVYTDPDVLPDERCPPDAVRHFCTVLLWYAGPIKVGFGLRIDDLPDRYRHKGAVVAWESRFQDPARRFRPGLLWASIDTTFALYSPRAPYGVPGVRTDVPYVARHLPWYADSDYPDEEELYYRRHAAPGVTYWAGEDLPAEFRRKLADLG